jgi:hypothetical protein
MADRTDRVQDRYSDHPGKPMTVFALGCWDVLGPHPGRPTVAGKTRAEFGVAAALGNQREHVAFAVE